MSDDLVKRLRKFEGSNYVADGDFPTCGEAADRIERLERALLDVAQYTSRVDMFHFVESETKKVLNEIGGRKMTGDIVKRLRRDLASGLSASIGDTKDAADRIERLEEALEKIAQHDTQALALDALRPGEGIRGKQ